MVTKSWGKLAGTYSESYGEFYKFYVGISLTVYFFCLRISIYCLRRSLSDKTSSL